MCYLNGPVTEFELFNFQDNLSKNDFKKVEDIFTNQCIKKKFTEFNTPFNDYELDDRKHYLSYLLCKSLINNTIKNDTDGYNTFLKMATDMRDSQIFIVHILYHTYNLGIIYNKVHVFDELLTIAEAIDNKNKNKKTGLPLYLLDSDGIKEMLFKERIESITHRVRMKGKSSFFIPNYAESHKKLESYLLKEDLQDSLPFVGIKRTKNKI